MLSLDPHGVFVKGAVLRIQSGDVFDGEHGEVVEFDDVSRKWRVLPLRTDVTVPLEMAYHELRFAYRGRAEIVTSFNRTTPAAQRYHNHRTRSRSVGAGTTSSAT